MKIVNYRRPLFGWSDLPSDFRNFFDIAEANNNIGSNFSPSINTKEDDKGVYIDIDLPGVKKEDISIEVHDNRLTVKGERKYKKEIKEDGYQKSESFFGKFERSFSLSNEIDEDNIVAKNNDGVLELFLPKCAAKEAKKIEIK
ncbi:Hsp20/alpha crystallin family protein [uncultured Campylobacter sp.]|uniref:Hsp20/alpha crystallin family protein n=1 Tax=uncultured Campylobacter sp. TaxID=218934 RepID=UPI00260271DE|nr:Hsp20/alpha crystallin family protein [uncultured Campylobacter sp.]